MAAALSQSLARPDLHAPGALIELHTRPRKPPRIRVHEVDRKVNPLVWLAGCVVGSVALILGVMV